MVELEATKDETAAEAAEEVNEVEAVARLEVAVVETCAEPSECGPSWAAAVEVKAARAEMKTVALICILKVVCVSVLLVVVDVFVLSVCERARE